MAKTDGRKFIGFEVSAEYIEVDNERNRDEPLDLKESFKKEMKKNGLGDDEIEVGYVNPWGM